MKKKWKLDNKGMTLLEVIVAFAIFAIAATILISYFGGALRIMGNSNAVKDASQKGTSALESIDLDAEEDAALGENVSKESGNISVWVNEASYNADSSSASYNVAGTYFTATEQKSNDKTNILQQIFKAAPNTGFTPKPVPEPDPVIPKPDVPSGNDVGKDGSIFKATGNDKKYNGSYNQTVDNYKIGVIEVQPDFNENNVVNNSAKMRQLYFTKNPPFIFQNKGASNITFDLDFLYINGDISIVDNAKEEITLTNSSSPKENNKGYVLIYFNQENTRITNGMDITIIPKGYYYVMSGTKLISDVKTILNSSITKYDVKQQAEIVSNYYTNLWN